MDLLNNIMKCFNQGLEPAQKNIYLYGILAIFIALYGPRLYPIIPKEIRQIFNNNMFRFIMILVIIYTTDKDISMALIIAIAFLIIMSLSNAQDIKEDIKENIREKFSDFRSIREFYEEEFENKQPAPYPPKNEKPNPSSACSTKDDNKDLEPFFGGLTSKPNQRSGFWNKLEHFQHEVDEDYNNVTEHYIGTDNIVDPDMDEFETNSEAEEEVPAEAEEEGEEEEAVIEQFTQYNRPDLKLAQYENQLRQTMNTYTFNK